MLGLKAGCQGHPASTDLFWCWGPKPQSPHSPPNPINGMGSRCCLQQHSMQQEISFLHLKNERLLGSGGAHLESQHFGDRGRQILVSSRSGCSTYWVPGQSKLSEILSLSFSVSLSLSLCLHLSLSLSLSHTHTHKQRKGRSQTIFTAMDFRYKYSVKNKWSTMLNKIKVFLKDLFSL